MYDFVNDFIGLFSKFILFLFKIYSYSSYSNSNDKGNYRTLKIPDALINDGKLTRSPYKILSHLL